MSAADETLHEALASVGVNSTKEDGFDSRALYHDGKFIGEFDAQEAWELVKDLRIQNAVGKAQTFARLIKAPA